RDTLCLPRLEDTFEREEKAAGRLTRGPLAEVSETFSITSFRHEAPGEHHDRCGICLRPADGLLQRVQLKVGHDWPFGGHRARAGGEREADGDREYACDPVHRTHFTSSHHEAHRSSVGTKKELTRDLRSRVHPARATVKVTFLNSRNGCHRYGYNPERGETIWSALPSREGARSDRRALDIADRTGPAEGPRAIPGPPCSAVRHPAEVACRSPAANAAPRAGDAGTLLEAPTACLIYAQRAWAWSRPRGGRAGDVGPAVRGSPIGSSTCGMRTSDGATALLPAL